MLKVFLSGGIGNRLFQLSFARFLRDEQKYEVGVVQLEDSTKPTTLDIETVLDRSLEIRKKSSLTKVSLKLIDPWRTLSPYFLWGRRYDFRYVTQIPISELGKLSSSGHIVGYFQDYNFVRNQLSSLVVELSSYLSVRCKTIETNPYEVIHVRGLDYRKNQNSKNIGELSDMYYQSLLSKKSEKIRFCLTDDLSYAQLKLRNCHVDFFFGPDELDALNSLNLLRNAKKIICANSTFSWWGGVLAVSNLNAKVVIPKPFFRSPNLNYGRGLDNPLFSTEPSNWLD